MQCLFPVASDSSSYRVWFFYTEKAYAAYDVCLGKYVMLNGIYEDNRGKGPAEFKYKGESQPE